MTNKKDYVRFTKNIAQTHLNSHTKQLYDKIWMFPVLGQDISFHNLPGRVDAKMTMRRADKVVVQFSIMQKELDCSILCPHL